MHTKVQQYLLKHSLEQLRNEHGVKARVAGHKVSLNYDQIEADERDPVAKECRGLVLAREDGKSLSLDEPMGKTIMHGVYFRRVDQQVAA